MLSRRTEAELIRAAEDAYTHDGLGIVFMRLGISGDPELAPVTGRSKVKRLQRAVELLRGEDRVMDLVREVVEDKYEGRIDGRGDATPKLRRLIEALRIDGFDLMDERIVATTPGPAALAPQISRLERDLEASGFVVARNHYRQAVESFVDGRLEAANGQLRSALEGFLLELCSRLTGQTVNDPKAAVDRLRNAGHLDGDEAQLLKGLIGVSNNRGAHQGLTDQDEALFRLHFTTAAIAFTLAHRTI